MLLALRRLSSPRRRRSPPPPPPLRAPLDAAAAARFAALALKCLHQEYPNHISHTLNSAADVRAPHELTPAFYGCLDWHSDVHGHWLLVRLLRLFPDAPFAAAGARRPSRAVSRAHNIAGETAYLHGAGRASFERPYGLAWLLQLAAELRRWDDADARRWSATLAAARNRGGGTPRELAAEAALSDPHRRARPDRLLLRPHLGLDPGDAATRSCARCSAMPRSASTAPIATARSPTSPRARTSSRHAWRRRTSCGACCRRRSSPRWLSGFLPQIPHAVKAAAAPWLSAGGGDRPRRPEACAHRRTEPESRLDARGHRARPAAARSAHSRTARRGAGHMPTQRCLRSPASTTRAATGSVPSRYISPARRASVPDADGWTCALTIPARQRPRATGPSPSAPSSAHRPLRSDGWCARCRTRQAARGRE